MKIELRRLAEITPYEKNPRINDAAVDTVAKSIQAFGWRQPIVVDKDGVIVVGHTRWKAAQKLGMAEVPVHVALDLTPEAAKGYRIADNKSADIADWDVELLPIELKELEALNFDLSLLGFSNEELNELLAPPVNEGQCDADEIPAPPDAAITKPGDLWILGEHRLLCGDSGSTGDVDRLLDGAVIHIVNTDPPYGVAVEPRSNNAIAAGLSTFPSGQKMHLQGFDVARQGPKKATGKKLRAKDRPLANDALTDDQFRQRLLDWFGQLGRVLLPGRAFYIWGGYANCKNYPGALEQCGLYFAQAVIWDKQHPVLGRKDFLSAHEWCFYGWREGAAHQFYGPNNIPDLWSIKKLHHASMVHLTEKPTELAARALQYSSKPGEHVLDLFGGSGSTLIAAEQHGRRAFLMELDPLYCDVIVQRWEKFTGKKARRIATDGAESVYPEKTPVAAGDEQVEGE